MGIVRRLSHQKKLSIIPKLIETIFTVKMMKRMLMFICLIASIRSTFCLNEMNEMKQRNDPDWTEPVECKPSEHCCLKSAAGGFAKCCPNRIQMGAWPYGGM